MNCPYDNKACSTGFSMFTCQNCPRFDRETHDEILAKRIHIPDIPGIPEDPGKYPLMPDECFKLDKKRVEMLADCMNAARDENDICTPLDVYKEIKRRGLEILKVLTLDCTDNDYWFVKDDNGAIVKSFEKGEQEKSKAFEFIYKAQQW